jgi:two-component system LytT family response regulator
MKVLIVDDEMPARERLRRLLAAEPEVEIVGECADGEEALDRILQGDVDVVFLDVQMPRLDGLSMLEALPSHALPVVVFITAYDEYAVRAFDAHAIDYILKPYDRERFHRALEKARTYLAGEARLEGTARLNGLVSDFRESPFRQRIAVKGRGRTIIVKVSSIDWIEAQGNYVRLHIGKESHLVRESMNQLADALDPATFLRIHRSAIVNLERIRELRADAHGDQRVVLSDSTVVAVGRAYRAHLEKVLGAE